MTSTDAKDKVITRYMSRLVAYIICSCPKTSNFNRLMMSQTEDTG